MTTYLRYRPQWLAAIAAAIGPLCAVCADTPPQPKSSQWNLTFSDEFNGPEVDMDKWEVLTRKDSYNDEKQYYLPSQASVVDGMLRITATNEPYDGKAYRSARLESWFTQAYGRFEARAKLPTTKAIWPAFWLLPRTGQWPHNGEIDIMENRGSNPVQVQCASHFADDEGNHDHIYKAYSAKDDDGKPISFSEGFHVYAVEWSPDVMVFSVDGIEYYRANKAQGPVPSTPMCIILNTAVGGLFDGDPDETTVFPQHFDIDYVRVYQRTEGDAEPPPAPSEKPDPD